MSYDYQKRLWRRIAETYDDALKQAEGEEKIAYEKLQHFEMLLADAKAYEAWDGIVEQLERQKEAVEADWLRRKKIAELCKKGYNTRFGDVMDDE